MKTLSQELADTLNESGIKYYGGFDSEPDVPNKTGEKPWPASHDHGRESGRKQRTPLMIGATVVVRTKGGIPVVDGYIEGIMDETRTVRVRDMSSGADSTVEVNLDRYDVWVVDQETG